jgi:hypothetical protein
MNSSLAGNNPRVNSMFSQMMEITKDPEFKKASPDVQQMLLFGGVLGSQPSQIPTQEELDRMGGFQQSQARAAQELGKESIEKAYHYSTLAKLPQQISEGFGAQAALNILGARSAVDAMNQTLQAYPRMSFASVPYQGPQKYFS